MILTTQKMKTKAMIMTRKSKVPLYIFSLNIEKDQFGIMLLSKYSISEDVEEYLDKQDSLYSRNHEVVLDYGNTSEGGALLIGRTTVKDDIGNLATKMIITAQDLATKGVVRSSDGKTEVKSYLMDSLNATLLYHTSGIRLDSKMNTLFPSDHVITINPDILPYGRLYSIYRNQLDGLNEIKQDIKLSNNKS